MSLISELPIRQSTQGLQRLHTASISELYDAKKVASDGWDDVFGTPPMEVTPHSQGSPTGHPQFLDGSPPEGTTPSLEVGLSTMEPPKEPPLVLPSLPATPSGSPVADAPAPFAVPVPEKQEVPKPPSDYQLKLAQDRAAREEAKVQKAQGAAAAKEARKLAQAGLRVETWAAFDEAYVAKYGGKIIRNGTTNSLMASLVNRLGDAAPGVAAFYLRVTDPFIVRSYHSLNLLLQGAESYHMQWLSTAWWLRPSPPIKPVTTNVRPSRPA